MASEGQRSVLVTSATSTEGGKVVIPFSRVGDTIVKNGESLTEKTLCLSNHMHPD